MLNATKQEQQALLELARLEVELSRTNSALRVLDQNVEVTAARTAQLESAESLLDAHANLERLQGELTKVLADLDLVDQRVAQDQLKAKAVNSERELKAVEAELESLASRKRLLEDSQLNLMQEIEDSGNAIGALSSTRSTINQQLETLLNQVQDQVNKLGGQATELAAKRESTASQINASLYEAYRRKAERGVPIGQTLGRDCSACRLAINGVEFDAMMALPEEALPTCPNCDAFIIR
jgi:predicted  nucleic acid-binding Zn-ribbon protein